MTDIYLHIDARMADYIRTHPYPQSGNLVLVGRPLYSLVVKALVSNERNGSVSKARQRC